MLCSACALHALRRKLKLTSHLPQAVGKKYPGVYSKCLTVADGVSSITTILSKQLDEFKAAIDSDDNLKNGFHAVGLSQGNLLIRAYIQKYNDPPVKNYISICGPHNGEGTCPDNILCEYM